MASVSEAGYPPGTDHLHLRRRARCSTTAILRTTSALRLPGKVPVITLARKSHTRIRTMTAANTVPEWPATTGGSPQPYLYQTFTMADWITGTTTITLSLQKSVDDKGTSEITGHPCTPSCAPRRRRRRWVSAPVMIARGNPGIQLPGQLRVVGDGYGGGHEGRRLRPALLSRSGPAALFL